jgi:regulator-associated protein of mTOR
MATNQFSSSSKAARILGVPNISILNTEEPADSTIGVDFLSQPWHSELFMHAIEKEESKPTWRLKDRTKTAGVALVACLNIGTDPPDILKPASCARRECWLDTSSCWVETPTTAQKEKLHIEIGNALQRQYEKWQSKAKYKQCLDPTFDDLRRLCSNLRKGARSDRLLFHYNGHGYADS